MTHTKRCPECIRPICQCVLTLDGCKDKHIEEIKGTPLNPYTMIDLFSTG